MYAVKPAGTRERTREFTSKPAHFRTAKRRRIERLSYRGIQGKGSEVLHLPVSPRRSSLPPSAHRSFRGCSLFHSDVLPFTPVSLITPSRSPPAFVPRLPSPPSFALKLSLAPSFSPLGGTRPLIPNVRTPAYTSLLLTTTGLLLTLAYYYVQWRIDDLPFQPSPPRATARFLPGNFREGRKGDAYSPRRRDLCTLFPSSFLEKLPLQCAPNLDGELLRIYFIY